MGGGRDGGEEGREGEQPEHRGDHTVRGRQHHLQLQVDLLVLLLLHHDVLWRRCYAFHGLNGRHGRNGRHEFDGWRLQHGRHDEQDDVKHGLDADGVFIIEDVILISFLLLLLVLLLLDDEQQHVLDAWRRQWWDVSASDAWNGDARVPLHARHDHRGDALSSFHPRTCLRDPLHRHLTNVTTNPQGGSQRGLQAGVEQAQYSPDDITIKLNGRTLTIEAA